MNSLKNRLRNTDAIGFFDKLSLNGKIESLIENFRRLHQGDGEATMASLAIQFAILIDETLALLRDGDQDLHARIQAARGGLWRLFSNPVDFAAAFEGENITLASNSDNRD
ncbi:MAG: hypothetical protein OEU46_01965 [Alphaproteobacteria bacterium]|nr:hypothetical protein [Alphaproteobacteria bacterium]